MVVASPLDEETVEKKGDCTKAGFPICLDKALNKLFGANGKRALDSIVMNDTFENTEISSLKDVCKLYEMYMERAANILGDPVARTIEFQSLNQARCMRCASCPLYEKRKISERSERQLTRRIDTTLRLGK
ncbi:MAG: hypothetical protein ACYCPP_09700, partial [Nitrososphaerales archaeon]